LRIPIMSRSTDIARLASLTVVVALLFGCAGSSNQRVDAAGAAGGYTELTPEARARADQARVLDLNRQLTAAGAETRTEPASYDYRLGPGDVVKIEAPQVPEINDLSVRIAGPGTVSVPLLGELKLGGLTTRDAERLLVQRLDKYVHNPQATLFISEYASQEITVTGAVAKPGVYPIQRPHTLVEVLSMVGGLTANAGSLVDVRTQVPIGEPGQGGTHRLLVDLTDLVKNPNAQALVLHGGDTVYVPEAGVFFVEGAVAKPGSYPLRPGITVLKAVTVAGGTNWEAVQDKVRVIRHDEIGVPRELDIDLAAVRDRGAPDMLLEDGDVVVVDTNSVKKGAVVMWNQTLRVLSLGVLYQ